VFSVLLVYAINLALYIGRLATTRIGWPPNTVSAGGRPTITPSATPSDMRMAASRFDIIRRANGWQQRITPSATQSALRMAATDGYDFGWPAFRFNTKMLFRTKLYDVATGIGLSLTEKEIVKRKAISACAPYIVHNRQ